MDDVRRMIYGTLAIFVAGILVWIGYLYTSACGFTTSCHKASAIAPVDRTAIPTLLPATLPVSQPSAPPKISDSCEISATDLIGTWVEAKYPEAEPFEFVDQKGLECQGTFTDDIQPLFTKADLWFPGSLACTTCHGAEVRTASAHLDLTSYTSILEGSQRDLESPDVKGVDILGGGDWESSMLYETLYVRKFMPPGHPPELPAGGPVIFAGMPR